MDEREMFEAWVDARKGSSLRSGFDGTLDYPLGNIMWEVWQAGRRTTPDREAIIEECAKVCDEYSIDRFALFKGRKPYTGREPGRADPYYDGASDGADRCAQLIRELKTAPTSDKGGA
ncbi:hypothetical protein [Burkholderia cenocepacia]|uniref:hypothetical protein n=1 Tax=Burkholderia cenocepacia TaxID=95486 RepID=UPI001CF26BAE|nr:hypothetical protein [Burkholderia cenocepacia]MCA8237694.1 hypothetical protein [Burkholderia cenocepacia]